MPTNYSLTEAYEIMLRNDPDGWAPEPSENDYKLFKQWAVATFGQEAYDSYMGTSWAERRSDV